MRHGRGFTIIELMLAIVVLGFLAALAVPSFNQMIARNNLTTASNDLVVALLTARSEAVKRERYVTLSPGNIVEPGSIDCIDDVTLTQWETGYIGFIDINNNKDKDVGEQETIRHEVSCNLDIDVAGNIGTAVTYDPEGRAVGSLGPLNGIDFFTITPDDQYKSTLDDELPVPTRVVCLTLFGRPYVPDTPPYPYVQSGADCS